MEKRKQNYNSAMRERYKMTRKKDIYRLNGIDDIVVELKDKTLEETLVDKNKQKPETQKMETYPTPKTMSEKKIVRAVTPQPKPEVKKEEDNTPKEVPIVIQTENISVLPKPNKTLLVGIGKMENHYIREWVEFHKILLGFDKVCLIDNNDVDGERYEEVIGDYIDSGYVILEDYRGVYRAQIQAYDDVYHKYSKYFDWMMFIDIDEFLILDGFPSIKDFLKQPKFDNYDCIRLNWKNYSDSGLVKVVDGNYSITRFTKPAKTQADNRQTKPIMRTKIEGVKMNSAHGMVKTNILRVCDALGNPSKNAIMVDTCVHRDAWVNHYRCKTIEEYVLGKMQRLWPTDYKNGGKDALDLDFFFRLNERTPEKVAYAKKLLKDIETAKAKAAEEAKAKALAEEAIKQAEEEKKKTLRVTGYFSFQGNKPKHRNWGDELNFLFLQEITNDKLTPDFIHNKQNYAFIGSIISDAFVNNNTIIWGAGIADSKIKLSKKPKEVRAVRGPLTRKRLIAQGISCPEVYGDPALLIPYHYNPKVKKKYKIGLIPHWSSLDKGLISPALLKDKDVHVIRMKDYKKWTDVIDEMLSCEYIVSESLHGLILAEAYGIPNVWAYIQFRSQPMKFHDFFLFMGKDREKPFNITRNTTKSELLKACQKYVKCQMPDLQPLIDACPFKIKNIDYKK